MQSVPASGEEEENKLDELMVNMEGETTPAEKGKRRYWTAKEEDMFYEIWGRDNWRLTKNGRNTVFFAKWAKEMKERFDVDIKPEEVQTKVNQTRAKFRAVKKQYDSNKTPTRWKKFNIIDSILRNQYRPADAEPVPLEALEKNRDMSTEELSVPISRQPTPTSTSNSTQDAIIAQDGNVAEIVGVCVNKTTEQHQGDMQLNTLNDPIISGTLYTPTSDTSGISYSSELFNDPMEDAKKEFEDKIKQEEFTNDYHIAYSQYPEQNHYTTEQPQLHQLQTPQQQQFLQQQHVQQYQAPQTILATHTQHNLQQHIQQLQQQQQEQEQTPTLQEQLPTINAYEISGNAYVTAVTPVDNNTIIVNNQNHFVEIDAAPVVTQPQPQQQQSTLMQHTNNTTFLPNHNNTNTNATNNAMHPPARNVTHAPQYQRKRRNTSINSMASPTVDGADTFEAQYLDEVRKKNVILAEQKEIGAKRLQLEQRKVDLLENFFPQCLALQEQILQKLNNH